MRHNRQFVYIFLGFILVFSGCVEVQPTNHEYKIVSYQIERAHYRVFFVYDGVPELDMNVSYVYRYSNGTILSVVSDADVISWDNRAHLVLNSSFYDGPLGQAPGYVFYLPEPTP